MWRGNGGGQFDESSDYGEGQVEGSLCASGEGAKAGGSSSSVAGAATKEQSKKRDTHRHSGSRRRSTRLRGDSEEADAMQDATTSPRLARPSGFFLRR